MTTPGKNADQEENHFERATDADSAAGADDNSAAVEEESKRNEEEQVIDLEAQDLEQASGADPAATADDSMDVTEESKGNDEEEVIDLEAKDLEQANGGSAAIDFEKLYKKLCSEYGLMAQKLTAYDTMVQKLTGVFELNKKRQTDGVDPKALQEIADPSEPREVDLIALSDRIRKKYKQSEAMVNRLQDDVELHRVRDPNALDTGDQTVLDALRDTKKYAGDEQRRYALMFLDSMLELLNEVSDIALCISQLVIYKANPEEIFHLYIFIASLCVIILEIALRIIFGVVLDINELKKDSYCPPPRQYKPGVQLYQKVVAGAVMLFEPNLAEAFFYANITETTRELNPGNDATYAVRDFYNLYEEIKMDLSTRQFLMMIFLIEDIPELIIEVLLAVKEKKGKIDTILLISLVATTVHLTRHSWSLYASWRGKNKITTQFGDVLKPSDLFKFDYTVEKVLKKTKNYPYEQVIEVAFRSEEIDFEKEESEFNSISLYTVQEGRKTFDNEDDDLHHWKNLKLKENLFEEQQQFCVLEFKLVDQGWGYEKGRLCIVENDPDKEINTETIVASQKATHNEGNFKLLFFPKHKASKPLDYSLFVKIGGGGGHKLHVSDVSLRTWEPKFNVEDTGVSFSRPNNTLDSTVPTGLVKIRSTKFQDYLWIGEFYEKTKTSRRHVWTWKDGDPASTWKDGGKLHHFEQHPSERLEIKKFDNFYGIRSEYYQDEGNCWLSAGKFKFEDENENENKWPLVLCWRAGHPNSDPDMRWEIQRCGDDGDDYYIRNFRSQEWLFVADKLHAEDNHRRYVFTTTKKENNSSRWKIHTPENTVSMTEEIRAQVAQLVREVREVAPEREESVDRIMYLYDGKEKIGIALEKLRSMKERIALRAPVIELVREIREVAPEQEESLDRIMNFYYEGEEEIEITLEKLQSMKERIALRAPVIELVREIREVAPEQEESLDRIMNFYYEGEEEIEITLEKLRSMQERIALCAPVTQLVREIREVSPEQGEYLEGIMNFYCESKDEIGILFEKLQSMKERIVTRKATQKATKEMSTEEIRAEVEQLIREEQPEAEENLDEIIQYHFDGKDELLLKELRMMKEREEFEELYY
jgi:hypothetical protein